MFEERAGKRGAARHLGELRGDMVGQTLVLQRRRAWLVHFA
jgi:hypothetical protein